LSCYYAGLSAKNWMACLIANALLTGNLKRHVFAVFLAKQVPL